MKEVTPKTKFGQMIRAHRMKLGLSQKAMASAIGVSCPMIGAAEIRNSELNDERVGHLADLFKLRGKGKKEFVEAGKAARRRLVIDMEKLSNEKRLMLVRLAADVKRLTDLQVEHISGAL